jgi:hypothetical protein
MGNQLHSKYVGNALVFWQGHRNRWVDAIGSNVTKYIHESWMNSITTVDPPGWTATVVEVGTGTTEWDALPAEHGSTVITPAANENDGGSYQLLGDAFKFATDNYVYAHVTLEELDADQSDTFFGFAVTDTAILAGVTDRIGFESLDSSASLAFLVEKNSTQTSSAAQGTLVDATALEVEMLYDGPAGVLYGYIDGVRVTSPALTNLPDDVNMRLSIEHLTGEAVANTLKMTGLRAIQIDAS